MAERDIAAEVLQGLREVKEYRAGKRTLRTTRVEAKPCRDLCRSPVLREAIGGLAGWLTDTA